MVSFEDNFHLSDGVELSTERYNIAQNIKNICELFIIIHYYNKDLFDINLQIIINVIYTSNLCFKK